MTTPLSVWDYRAEYDDERDAILAAVDQVLRSGRLILGDQVRRFEEAFASYCGATHGVGVNSGTDAILLALRAFDIGAGDEVITVPNTAIPTVSAIVSAGAVPRFIDIDPDTGLMDVRLLAEAVTPRTRAIIPVHLYGQCVDMDAVQEVARSHGLVVIEDCSQCTGADYKGRRAGSMSHAAAFSFYPTKVLGTFGDGGMVVTSDAMVAARIKRLRMYGTDGRYFAEEHGYNSRLDELHAAILLTRLPRLPQYIAARQTLAARYDAGLAGLGLGLPQVAAGNTHVYHLYPVRHPARNTLIRLLQDRGIHVGVHYPWPIHLMPPYSDPAWRSGTLTNSERVAKQLMSLPLYPTMPHEAQDRVIRELRDALASLPPAV